MAWAKKSSKVSFFHARANVASFSQFFKIFNSKQYGIKYVFYFKTMNAKDLACKKNKKLET
jgi:hypothetical protein